jgi:hypothetical protein
MNKEKIKQRIELAMAFDKKHAESKVLDQTIDLLEHGLKFLIHKASFDGDYGYWQKDIVSTLFQISDKATNVKKQGTLKQKWVATSLASSWENQSTVRHIIYRIYQDNRYDSMTKRYTRFQDFFDSLNLEPTTLEPIFTKLVKAIYDDAKVGGYSYEGIATDFFADLKTISK